jgi:hypothetical protein
VFASKGVDVSIDELLAFRARVKQEAGRELSDEELALVAGGASEEGALFMLYLVRLW